MTSATEKSKKRIQSSSESLQARDLVLSLNETKPTANKKIKNLQSESILQILPKDMNKARCTKEISTCSKEVSSCSKQISASSKGISDCSKEIRKDLKTDAEEMDDRHWESEPASSSITTNACTGTRMNKECQMSSTDITQISIKDLEQVIAKAVTKAVNDALQQRHDD